MDVKQFLSQHKVDYRTTPHSKVFTAQEVAAVEHVPGAEVAKTVIVRRQEGGYAMLVCPASFRVDLERVGQMLGGKVRLASESEMRELFGDVELGAEPPFGSQYGLPTFVDESLAMQDHITFRSGRHTETVTMKWQEYYELEQPRIVQIARHL